MSGCHCHHSYGEEWNDVFQQMKEAVMYFFFHEIIPHEQPSDIDAGVKDKGRINAIRVDKVSHQELYKP